MNAGLCCKDVAPKTCDILGVEPVPRPRSLRRKDARFVLVVVAAYSWTVCAVVARVIEGRMTCPPFADE